MAHLAKADEHTVKRHYFRTVLNMKRWILLSAWMVLPAWVADSTGLYVLRPDAIVRGIDVSHHQKRIEWDTLQAKEPVGFAFVKATEGSDFSDSLYCYNWEALQRLQIKRGAYHFFRGYGCGVEQATHFLRTVEMQAGDLPPVLDIETLDGVIPGAVVEEAKIWLQTVENALGIQPIIYTNQHFYERFLAHAGLEQYPLWIARYSDERPLLSNGRKWAFWQHTNEGCLEGICQKVDMNIFLGTAEMLQEMSWQPAPSAAMP